MSNDELANEAASGVGAAAVVSDGDPDAHPNVDSASPSFRVIEFNAAKQYSDVIQVLEEMLVQAREGRIIGLAGVFIMSRCEMATVITQGARDQIVMTIGSVEYLKSRLVEMIRGE